MKLVQFYLPEKGRRVGVVDRDGKIIDVTSDDAPGVLELIQLAHEFHVSLNVIVADVQDQIAASTPMILPDEPAPPEIYYDDLGVPPDESVPHLLMPITPPEVWGFGVTYKRSANMRDDDSTQDIYSRVYFADRPELFFKATASRCVGPNDYIGIRDCQGSCGRRVVHDEASVLTKPYECQPVRVQVHRHRDREHVIYKDGVHTARYCRYDGKLGCRVLRHEDSRPAHSRIDVELVGEVIVVHRG